MQLPDADTQPPNVEVESVRFMQKPGAKHGTLSVVVGGVNYIWKCSRVRMLVAGETLFEAIRKSEDAC